MKNSIEAELKISSIIYTSMLKVIVFEDNKTLCESICHIINSTDDLKCVNAYYDAEDLINKINSSEPNIVIMDIDLPGINGIEATRIINEKFPGITILIQTIFEDDDKIYDAICAGASGYLLKNSEPMKLLEAIREVNKGGAPMNASVARKVLRLMQNKEVSVKTKKFDLSPREIEVLQHVVKGMSYKMIADACNLSIDGIRFHTRNIYEKLHVHSKSEAIILALKNKIV